MLNQLIHSIIPLLEVAGGWAKDIQPYIIKDGLKNRKKKQVVGNQNIMSAATTRVDIAIEEKIRTSILRMFPDIGFIGEEQGAYNSALKTEFTVIFDPINGTQYFLTGSADYDFVVTILNSQGKIVVAMSYIPNRDTLYVATNGVLQKFIRGKYVAFHPSSKPVLATYSATPEDLIMLRRYFDIYELTSDWTGSDSHNFCTFSILEGECCGVFARKCGLYDWGAMAFACKQAGGYLLTLDGEEDFYWDTSINQKIDEQTGEEYQNMELLIDNLIYSFDKNITNKIYSTLLQKEKSYV